MNVYVTELEKWVESGLSTFEIRRLVAEICFRSWSLSCSNMVFLVALQLCCATHSPGILNCHVDLLPGPAIYRLVVLSSLPPLPPELKNFCNSCNFCSSTMELKSFQSCFEKLQIFPFLTFYGEVQWILNTISNNCLRN